jgi:ATP-dependent exoDNAse (exonuclease V) beta subunit
LAGSVADEVKRLLDLVDGTIGVITPAARLAEFAAVVADPADRRVLVVDAMRAKGLEYDAVVVVAPEEIAAESATGVRVLYVALTRATHRLVTIGPTPPL